ncbi:ASCH domain-containing protein [Clostridium perfringens]|uniref:ASCH domain-containing protein n=1 Tax=Clostridium perfringens TaxID=1502 RepID=UPI000D514C87|nr:ASCH domain-containing protein [Clostridium perfringens]EJT6662899.1 ASCH domain-containing protein [Clostridium perfringens]MDM0616977.1 ASCH domain-containing protein [Clostridium perfringens]MDU4131333.1 ASCH domain-containing protein [Clostridium perfringens]MDU6143998.1 ASCH domain-containing protein [Clostridium perfringens]PVE17629.1 hypothetical protein DDA98_03290 [Clostridium perfringens]
MKAILSIKPDFVNKILSGEKKFEYRKKIFKQPVETVVIYSSSPVQKFVGEFTISNILCSDILNIWKETKSESGISYNYYRKYFSKHKKAYALEISNLKIYEEPINPTDVIPDFKPPQSYCYLKD